MKRRKNYYYLAAPSRVLTRRAIRKQFTDGRCLVILTLLYLAVLSLYSLLLLVILLGEFFMRLCVFFAFVQSCQERNFYSNGTSLGGYLKQLAMNGLSKLKYGAINVELIFTNPHLPSHYILDLQRGGCDMHLQQIMPSGNQFVFNRRLNQHSSIFRSFYCLFDVSA